MWSWEAVKQHGVRACEQQREVYKREKETGSGHTMTAADRRKLNKDAGFSLLELLIAVVILAIIVIPLLNLFLSSNRLNIKSRQTLRATTLAQDIMEGLKAYDIEELKTQFNKPTDGFYVIDDNLIKGAIAEEYNMEVDGSGNPEPGIYYFSLRDVSMQGSKFDALVKVDARGYMEGSTAHDNLFNNSSMADARSIDKNNGTFVETDEIRKAMLSSVWKDSAMKTALEAGGVTKDDFDKIYFKNQDTLFTGISRFLTIDLKENGVDEDGKPKIDMSVTDEYEFTYGAVTFITKGDIDVLEYVDKMACGSVSGDEVNINIFYYPLYGSNVWDEEIIINNDSNAELNLLIAKQVPSDTMNPSNPEILTDAQLMAAEMDYYVNVKIKNGSGDMAKEKFTLKTNLGLNLAGKKYMAGESDPAKRDVNTPSQMEVNDTPMDLSGTSGMNIYTLDGVRSPMGAAPADGDVTELIYDVEVSVYKEGAADKDFPDEERMIVIEGSKNN